MHSISDSLHVHQGKIMKKNNTETNSDATSGRMKRLVLPCGVTLYQGDCLEILPALEGVDAVITDPPYGFDAYVTDKADNVVKCLEQFEQRAVFGYPETLIQWCMDLGVPDEWVTWAPTNKFGRSSKTLPRNSEAIAIWGSLYEMPRRKRTADASTIAIAEAQGNIVGKTMALLWRVMFGKTQLQGLVLTTSSENTPTKSRNS